MQSSLPSSQSPDAAPLSPPSETLLYTQHSPMSPAYDKTPNPNLNPPPDANPDPNPNSNPNPSSINFQHKHTQKLASCGTPLFPEGNLMHDKTLNMQYTLDLTEAGVE